MYRLQQKRRACIPSHGFLPQAFLFLFCLVLFLYSSFALCPVLSLFLPPFLFLCLICVPSLVIFSFSHISFLLFSLLNLLPFLFLLPFALSSHSLDTTHIFSCFPRHVKTKHENNLLNLFPRHNTVQVCGARGEGERCGGELITYYQLTVTRKIM